MRTRQCLGAVPLAAACAGCAPWQAPVAPPYGVLYTRYRAPITTGFDETATGGKTGRSSTWYVRGLVAGLSFAWSDASIRRAAAAGGLSRINYADYEVLEVLTVFGRFTVTVHGE